MHSSGIVIIRSKLKNVPTDASRRHHLHWTWGIGPFFENFRIDQSISCSICGKRLPHSCNPWILATSRFVAAKASIHFIINFLKVNFARDSNFIRDSIRVIKGFEFDFDFTSCWKDLRPFIRVIRVDFVGVDFIGWFDLYSYYLDYCWRDYWRCSNCWKIYSWKESAGSKINSFIIIHYNLLNSIKKSYLYAAL